jgi:hypothetical protein
MVGADVMVMWIDSQSVFQLSDRYTTGRSSPPADTQQDLTALSYQRTNGKTVYMFKRAGNTKDTNDFAITGGQALYYWLLATRPDNIPSSVNGTLLKHSVQAVSSEPMALSSQSQVSPAPMSPSTTVAGDANSNLYDQSFGLGALLLLAFCLIYM